MNGFRFQPDIWEFLEQKGVLEKGTDEEIKAAKKEYRKQYLLAYKRWQRENKPEFSVYFSKERGEFQKIKRAATEHRMTIPAFLKKAVFAYLDKTYVVPDREAVSRMELLLSQCFTEVQKLAGAKNLLYWQQFEDIQKCFQRMEREMVSALRHPLSLEDLLKSSLERDASLRERLSAVLLAHDCKDKGEENPDLPTTS
jgi:hypothetical protein